MSDVTVEVQDQGDVIIVVPEETQVVTSTGGIGPPGPPGPPGEPGPMGPAGPGGISNLFNFQFSTNTTPPPTGSQIRMNVADQTLATQLWVRYDTSDGIDVHSRLLLAEPDQLVYMQDKDDAAKWQSYMITGTPTDVSANSYVNIPVRWFRGGTALLAQAIVVQLLSHEEEDLPTSYVHEQMIPADTWVIDHGLAFFPNVTVIDSAGETVEGDIAYTPGRITLSFSGAFSGTAYLS